MITSRLASRILATLTLIPSAFCAAGTVDGLEVRGFGSSGIQAANSDYSLPSAGIDGRNVDYSRLTKAGVNLRSVPLADLAVAAQFVASLKAATFAPEITWGFVDYEVTSGMHVRAGRLLPPVWLFSQQVDVGFSLPWIDPPREVYSLNPLRSLNGAALFGRRRLGSGILEYDLIGGGGESLTELSTLSGAESATLVRIRDAIGGALSYSWADILRVRLGYFRARTSIDLYSTVPVPGVDYVYSNLRIPFDANVGRFYSAGLDLSLGPWSVVGEWARRDLDGTAIPRAEAAYVSAGYEFGRFKPRATYSKLYKYTGQVRPHPAVARGVSSLQEAECSLTGGLGVQIAEPVMAKFELSRTESNFDDPGTDFHYWVGRAAVNFVF